MRDVAIRIWPWLRDTFTLFFALFAMGAFLALLSAAAGAQTRTGWQVHVYFAVPRNGQVRTTIGPPFPTFAICQDVAFPLIVAMLDDRVRCIEVVDTTDDE